MKKVYKLFLIAFLLVFINQVPAQNKFEEMRNALLLGLETKGLEICNDLISLNEYKEYRSQAIFYIAEYFLSKTFNENDDINFVNKAYTFYSLYEKDYPNGDYIKIIKERKRFLENNFLIGLKFGIMLDSLYNEAMIVEKKLDFATALLKFGNPNIFVFFNESEFNRDSKEIVDKYFDEIIINYPEFEEYAYYYKILLKLSNFKEVDFVSEGILPFKKKNYKSKAGFSNTPLTDADKKAKIDIYNDLRILDSKYPSHPLTLNLHLILSKVFMTVDGDVIDAGTLRDLQFILNNDQDQTDIRYMLAKEFILNNKFEKEGSEK